jgi:hypothetical protein
MDDDDDVAIIIAADSTGIKVTNRGLQWMQDKWDVKKQERISKDKCRCKYKDQRNSCTGSYR